MYHIIHLSWIFPGGSYKSLPTDYDSMDLGEAEKLVTELNRDAIESKSFDRWIVVHET